jgi:hypothetical protein
MERSTNESYEFSLRNSNFLVWFILLWQLLAGGEKMQGEHEQAKSWFYRAAVARLD